MSKVARKDIWNRCLAERIERIEEGWLSRADAMDLIDPIMHNNARQIFNLPEKTRMLQNVPWT